MAMLPDFEPFGEEAYFDGIGLVRRCDHCGDWMDDVHVCTVIPPPDGDGDGDGDGTATELLLAANDMESLRRAFIALGERGTEQELCLISAALAHGLKAEVG